MDANFSFPPSSFPRARPRPAKAGATGPRESNALRASVLDVALELGIGNNSMVTEWMFSNAVQEEDEESAQSPGLTHSYSTASTDEFSSSPRIPPTPPNASSSVPLNGVAPTSGKPIAGWDTSKLSTDTDAAYLPNKSFSPTSQPIAFPSYHDIPIPPRPVTPENSKKLKKKKGGDADDSDGGYLSDIGRKRKVTGDLSKKESKARLKEEKREQKREAKELEKEERKRKKSLGALAKASKKLQGQEAERGGYETDGAAASSSKSPFRSKTKKSKAKSPSTDAPGYETDAGYQSAGTGLKKSKGRFFGLGSKSSKGDLRDAHQASEPPQLPMPVMPLPIASKFATSLGALDPPPDSTLKFDPADFTTSPTTTTAPDSTVTPSTASPSGMTRPPIPTFHREPVRSQESLSSSTSPRRLDNEPLGAQPSSPTNALPDRSSLSSAETSGSSMSNNSRRRGLQFSPTRELNSSMGHGGGGMSISTVNSSTMSFSNQSFTASSTASNPQSPASPPTSYGHLGPSGLKPPSISLPLTRSTSPISPVQAVAPLQISKNPKLPQLDVNARASPLPFSNPNSPFVMVSHNPNSAAPSPVTSTRAISPLPPLGPRAVSPLPPPGTRAVSPLPPSTARSPPVRPLNPPTSGFGPQTAPPSRPAGLTSPPPATGRLSPNPMRGRRISPLNLPPDEYLNAGDPFGGTNSTLPSPNVLAYYDIPPPSPPPMGPLPSLPPVSSPNSANVPLRAASQLRNKVMERQKLVPELSSTIQRGKESPFPTRPVVLQQQQHQQRANAPSPFGFGARAVSPPRDNGRHVRIQDPQNSGWDDTSSMASSGGGLAYDAVEENENIQDVIERFADATSIRGSSEGHGRDDGDGSVESGGGRALARRRSFEALREKHAASFSPSEYYGGMQRETVYDWDDEDKLKNRESRWSGSIYSRISIMDPDKSEEARDRFVQRVEAMMAARGEEPVAVPPVPKIPEGLVNAGAWNRF